jgi:integrase
VVEGADPAAEKHAKRKAASIAELCDLYIADAEAGRLLTRRKVAKKPSTIATDKGRIDRHIKPLLGSMKVAAVTREDIDGFMHAIAEGRTAARTKTGKKRGLANVRGGKGTASRTVGLLGSIFSYSVRHRMRPDNPTHGVMRFADGKRDRRLSDDEYKMLGTALEKAAGEQIWPAAVAAVRFLALTGWRSGEVLGLRWAEIDLSRHTATLGDTKTGRSVRPLSHAACDVLRGLTREGDDALVFPATRGKGRMAGFPKMWSRVAKLGAGERDAAHNEAFVREPCRRSRLFGTDHCGTGRAQRTHDHIAVRARCRRRVARRGRCGRKPHGGIDGQQWARCAGDSVAT